MTKQKTMTKKAAAPKAKGPALAKTKPTSKLAQMEAMLRRSDGATIAQLSKALSWQPHSVRGAMSGSLKKERGLKITTAKEEGTDRVYRVAA